MFLYGFSLWTCLYEWLSIFLWVFVMYMFVRMTIHIIVDGFSSCTFLYEWLSISFDWVFVTYMFARMTIHILMGFRHVHVCTDDYPYYCYGLSSCTRLYEWLSISLCTGFSSCTFLYEWLSISFEWVLSCSCLYKWLSISLCMTKRHTQGNG